MSSFTHTKNITVHCTDFTIKVGDITYFTKNYRELLNEKLSYKESSQGKQKRAVVKPKSWQWPNCVIPYIIDEFYSGEYCVDIFYSRKHPCIILIIFYNYNLYCRETTACRNRGIGALGGAHLRTL